MRTASILVLALLAARDARWREKSRRAGVQIAMRVGEETWGTQTDAAGKFSFDRAPAEGEYEITASHPGMMPAHSSLYVDAQRCNYVFLALRPARTIRGKVLNERGMPAHGMTVRAQLASRAERDENWFAEAETRAN